MQKRRGFTTVELVIVIAVIAILATALIPTFGGLIDSANHNADIQTARNLSTQVMMYAMENQINDEADLRKALDAALGEGYYDNLEPKSARKGYCYWYDYNNCQIVLGTIEEIIAESQKKLAVPSDWDITMANGLTGNKDFAAGNMRTMVIPGYFLMTNDDKNPLSDVITSLENPSLINYGDALAKLYKLADSFKDNAVVKTAVDTFVQKVAQTPILTGKGLFLTSAATSISTIYVPYGTDELASINVYVATVTNGVAETEEKTTADIKDLLVPNFKLTMPQGTRFAANVLDLERVATAGNPFMTGSDEIHINIEEKDLGTYFFADTTDAVIVLPNGNRYIQNGTNFVKLTSEGQKIVEGVTAPAYGELKSFGIGFVADGAPSGTYVKDVPGEGNAYDLYISADHTGSITLTANNFKGIIDGAETTLPVRNITVVTTGTGIDAVTKGLTSTITGLKNGNTITITARDISYVYTVKVVDVNALDLESFSGTSATLNNNYGLTFVNTAADKWEIKPSIGYTFKDTGIALNTKLKVESANKLFSFNDETNELTLAKTLKGEYNDTLTITCRNKKMTIEVTLYDGALEAFVAHENVAMMNNKGKDYVIGTNGTYTVKVNDTDETKNILTLGHLFSLKTEGMTGVNVNGITLSITGAPEAIKIDSNKWQTYDIQKLLAEKVKVDGNTSLEISLSTFNSTSTAAKVKVYLVKGAYNVSNAAEWKAVPAETSIAVLDEFPIDGKDDRATCEGYEKNVGAATVYGNLQTITVTNFKHFTTAQANALAFIMINGGNVDHVIIDGPDYGDKVSITGNDSKNKGTYVHGVRTEGTSTISNSFISGFRAPVQVLSGKITLQNTVLHRGNYANLSVDGAKTAAKEIIADGLTTIQYAVGGNIGAGIAVKYNSGDTTITKGTNGLKQYNYYTETQIKSIASMSSSIISAEELGLSGWAADLAQGTINAVIKLVTKLDSTDFAKLNNVKHGNYYHVGIFELALDVSISGKGATGDPSVTIDGFSEYSLDNKAPKDTMGQTITVTVSGEKACSSTCTHGVLPTWDTDNNTNRFVNYKEAFLNYGWELED